MHRLIEKYVAQSFPVVSDIPAHSRTVAYLVKGLLKNMGYPETIIADMVTAAWMHDIGHSKEAFATGITGFDGHALMKILGYSDLVCKAVLLRTASHGEAELCDADIARYYHDQLEVLSREEGELIEVLTLCDLRTDSVGGIIPLETKLLNYRLQIPQSSPRLVNIENHADYFRILDMRYGKDISELASLR